MSDSTYLDKAHKLAGRSPMKRFGVGAVIVNGNKEVSTGWCHQSDLQLTEYISIHAETHAIYRANPKDLDGATIYIVTRSVKSNNRSIGKPCVRCAAMIHDAGIERIVYSIGNNEFGVWEIGDEPLVCMPTKSERDW
jgi:deoxycytidylate deaminase